MQAEERFNQPSERLLRLYEPLQLRVRLSELLLQGLKGPKALLTVLDQEAAEPFTEAETSASAFSR